MIKILEKLLTTEKTTRAKEGQNKYTFKVSNHASQGSVAAAVKKTHKVDVIDVNLMVIPGKKRRIAKTNRYARLPKWKKAIVELKEGQKIEEAQKAKEPKETK
jgi:large subunit ribosomal protein L23